MVCKKSKRGSHGILPVRQISSRRRSPSRGGTGRDESADVPEVNGQRLRLCAAGTRGGPLGALTFFAQTVIEKCGGDGFAVENASSLDLTKQFA